MSYEKREKRLNKMFQEMMSDEEIEGADAFEGDGTSDEYQPDSQSSDSDSDYEPPARKVRQQLADSVASTSQAAGSTEQLQEPASPESANSIQVLNTVDEIIDEVVGNAVYSDIENDNNAEEMRNPTVDFEWQTATGEYLKDIPFCEPTHGFNVQLYEHYGKSPYEFYKIFVSDAIIQFIVSIFRKVTNYISK